MPRLKEEGADGVRRLFEEIAADLSYTMAMTCSPDLRSIDPSIVHKANFSWL